MTLALFITIVTVASCIVVSVIFRAYISQSKRKKKPTLLKRVGIIIVLTGVVTILTSGLYLFLGQHQILINPWLAEPNDSTQLRKLLAQAQRKIIDDNQDVAAWLALGRGYMVLEEFSKAIQAFEKANQLIANDGDILLRLADAHTMNDGGQISDSTLKLLQQAYAINRDNGQVLWLLAIAHEQRNMNSSAIAYWRQLVAMLDEDPELQQQIQQQIATLSAQEQPLTYSVTINIDDKLQAHTKPEQIVFIFVTESGNAMPVAAIKRRVIDLPTTVQLDDSTSLSPTKMLSSITRFKVTARVSKTGQPIQSSGDYYGNIVISAKQKDEKHKVLINKQVP